jgi:hypothetical protein
LRKLLLTRRGRSHSDERLLDENAIERAAETVGSETGPPVPNKRGNRPLVIGLFVAVALIFSFAIAMSVHESQSSGAGTVQQTAEPAQTVLDPAAQAEQPAQAEQQTQERQEAATETLHFNTDPDNKLPLTDTETIFNQLYNPRENFTLRKGDRIRLRTHLRDLDLIGNNELYLIRQKLFFVVRFHIEALPGEQLKQVNLNDNVEMVCTVQGFRTIDDKGLAGFDIYLLGQEIQKLP